MTEAEADEKNGCKRGSELRNKYGIKSYSRRIEEASKFTAACMQLHAHASNANLPFKFHREKLLLKSQQRNE